MVNFPHARIQTTDHALCIRRLGHRQQRAYARHRQAGAKREPLRYAAGYPQPGK